MNEHTPPDAAPETPAEADLEANTGEAGLPAFDHRRLRREITRDRALRLLIAGLVGAGVFFFVGWMPGRAGVTESWGLLVSGLLVLGVWITLSVGNARAAGAARGLLTMIEHDPVGIEHALSGLVQRRGLVGWVRVMIYHTWAALRHRQGNHTEAAAVCHDVLLQNLGPGEGARPALLLMLAESSLECGNPAAAYPALCGLYTVPLTLIQALQRMGLQLRYEVTLGEDEAALRQWHGKTDMAELMPAPLSGATHAMLAVAAARQHHPEIAAWLDARARLLCTDEQLDGLRKQGLALGLSVQA